MGLKTGAKKAETKQKSNRWIYHPAIGDKFLRADTLVMAFIGLRDAQ